MKLNLAIAVLLLGAACKKQEPAKADVAPALSTVNGMKLVDYEEPTGAFSSKAPEAWKLLETSDLGPEATFIAPGTALRPNSVSIHIARYPNAADKSGDPKHYYDGYSLIETRKRMLEYGKRNLGGREVESYAFEREFRKMHSTKVEYWKRAETAIIRIPGGFWSISYSAPADTYKSDYAIFEAVVASFKPGAVPAK